MRNLAEERVDHARACNQAHAKVMAVERLVAGLKPGRPDRVEAERLLQQMRQNAAIAELNRAMFQFEDNQAVCRTGLP